MDKNLNALMNSATSKEDVENYVNKNLSQSEKEKIQSIISDKNKLNEILSNPAVQELMKKFRK